MSILICISVSGAKLKPSSVSTPYTYPIRLLRSEPRPPRSGHLHRSLAERFDCYQSASSLLSRNPHCQQTGPVHRAVRRRGGPTVPKTRLLGRFFRLLGRFFGL